MHSATSFFPQRRIRIFLASSNELLPKRDAVELWLRRLNDDLLKKNVFFEVVRWEEESMALYEPRAQDRYNEELEKCDGLIALFGTQVGSYTKEELRLAYDRFKKGCLPRKILVCFENVNVNMRIVSIEPGVRDVLDLQTELQSNGQVFAFFDSNSELRNIVEKEAKLWAQEFASTTDFFHITEEMVKQEVADMPNEALVERQVLNEGEVRALCDCLGLFKKRNTNGHLAFIEGDVAYWARLQETASRLQAMLRARKLILNQAEKLGILIWRQGQLSAHSQEIEALLMYHWRKSLKSDMG